jgi:transcriptional regulator with XRE-family HTH domain
MPKASPFPRHPVRVLRKTLGFTSADAFARFTGIPAETIRNLEQGRRAVSHRIAFQIGVATGVARSWLLTGNTARGKPLDVLGRQLTKDEFEKFRGVGAKLDVDPNEGDEAEEIEAYCDHLAIFLRAAARQGRLNQCGFFVRIALEDAEKQLGLSKSVLSERRSNIDHLFRSSTQFGEERELDWGNFYSAWKLLSPTAKFRWDAELSEKDAGASEILDEIDNLRDVVAASFKLAKRMQQPSRRPRKARSSKK